MRFRIQQPAAWVVRVVMICIVSVQLVAFTPVSATAGSVQITIQGFGIVHGQLENVTIAPNNSVSMMMVLNDQIQTSYGPAQITGAGRWDGVKNGVALSGQIHSVVGNVQACSLLCLSAHFVGQGNWNGSLNSSHGTGALSGTITFTDSPVPQIPVGQPIPVSGTWNSDFQIPVPEFGLQLSTCLILFAIVTFAVLSVRRATHKATNSADRTVGCNPSS
jgi:hypothetical protein